MVTTPLTQLLNMNTRVLGKQQENRNQFQVRRGHKHGLCVRKGTKRVACTRQTPHQFGSNATIFQRVEYQIALLVRGLSIPCHRIKQQMQAAGIVRSSDMPQQPLFR